MPIIFNVMFQPEDIKKVLVKRFYKEVIHLRSHISNLPRKNMASSSLKPLRNGTQRCCKYRALNGYLFERNRSDVDPTAYSQGCNPVHRLKWNIHYVFDTTYCYVTPQYTAAKKAFILNCMM